MAEYNREEILQKAYQRGYQKGIKLTRLEIITALLMQEYEQDYISKVTRATNLEIESVKIAIRMFRCGEDVEHVTKYTQYNIEEAKKIKDCIISEKKCELANWYSLLFFNNVI